MHRALRMAAPPLLWIAVLFLGAGRLGWLRGWLAVELQVGSMVAAYVIVHRRNPALIEARSRWYRADTKSFDKRLLKLFLPLTIAMPAVAGLDAGYYRWSHIPAWLGFEGAALFLLATAINTWVLAVNPYAETSVRIQHERGHKVVDAGPYRVVRHPMYVGVILTYPGMALVLGSVGALALSAVIAALFVWRTALEDRTLRRELPGYEEYAARTRYRLVPGLW